MFFSRLSHKIADIFAKELGYDEEKKEIIAYGIETTLLTIIGFLAILIVAFIFDALIPAAIAAICGGLLRKFSGGAHFNTPLKCLAFGAIIYSLLGVIAKNAENYLVVNKVALLIMLLFSLMVIAVRSPVDCEEKPIHSITLRKRLKLLSILFVILLSIIVIINNSTLVNLSLVLGVVYQTLTLLPIFNKRRCNT